MKRVQSKQRGQSTIEYILIVTVVLAAVIFFLSPAGGPLREAIVKLFDRSAAWTDTSAGKVPNTAAPQPTVQ